LRIRTTHKLFPLIVIYKNSHRLSDRLSSVIFSTQYEFSHRIYDTTSIRTAYVLANFKNRF
jgi:hypothetical protein